MVSWNIRTNWSQSPRFLPVQSESPLPLHHSITEPIDCPNSIPSISLVETRYQTARPTSRWPPDYRPNQAVSWPSSEKHLMRIDLRGIVFEWTKMNWERRSLSHPFQSRLISGLNLQVSIGVRRGEGAMVRNSRSLSFFLSE